jgi:hypothetical protein
MSFYQDTYKLPLSYDLRNLLSAIYESGEAGMSIIQLTDLARPAALRSEKETKNAFATLRAQMCNARRILKDSGCGWELLASEGRGNRSGAGFRGVYRLVRR